LYYDVKILNLYISKKFKNSKIQKFKNSKIQKFKNSKIQKFGFLPIGVYW
jgi:hypothetical protein